MAAAHSMSAIWWRAGRTECTGRWGDGGRMFDVHELGSRWQISIQFVEEYLGVIFFFVFSFFFLQRA